MFVSRNTTGFLLSGFGALLGDCCRAGVVWDDPGKEEGWPGDTEWDFSGSEVFTESRNGASQSSQPGRQDGNALKSESGRYWSTSPA